MSLCHKRMRPVITAEVDRGPRQANDWSIMDQNTCQCTDCQILNGFLQTRDLKQKIWPLAKSRRQHIHQIITAMRLPVTHQTEHTGSPHKLVLKKTQQLFTQDKTRQKNLNQTLGQLAKLKPKT